MWGRAARRRGGPGRAARGAVVGGNGAPVSTAVFPGDRGGGEENTRMYNKVISVWTKERTELWVKGTCVNFSGGTGEGVPLGTRLNRAFTVAPITHPSQEGGEAAGPQTQLF